MKKNKLVWIGCAAIGVGVVLGAAGIAAGAFNEASYLEMLDLGCQTDAPTASFHSVLVDADCADVTIQKGDTFSVEANAVDLENYSVTVENEILQVEQKQTAWISFSYIPQAEIVITLPEDSYRSLAIASDYGDCIVTDLNASTLSIQTDAGDCRVTGCTLSSGTISTRYGDSLVSDTTIDGTAMLCVSSGDVTLEAVSIQNGLKIEDMYGDAAIRDTDFGYLELALDCGDLTMQNSTAQAETTESSCTLDYGDVSMENVVLYDASFALDCGDLTLTDTGLYGVSAIQLSYGDANINLKGSAADYQMISDGTMRDTVQDAEENVILWDTDEICEVAVSFIEVID